MQRIIYRNLHLDIGSLKELKRRLLNLLTNQEISNVITVNPEFVVLTVKHPELSELTRKSKLNIIDGIGLAWALHKFGQVERYTGADAVQDICLELSKNHAKLGILIPPNGLSQPKDILDKIEKTFPGIQCSVWINNPDVVNEIQREKPLALLVTFGQPSQDLWIQENMAKLNGTSLAMGVGGSIDFITGARKRAPRFLRHIGLEWFWRLLTQPWRLPRILKATFGFWFTILFR